MKGADHVGRELIRAAIAKTYDEYYTGANVQQIVQWFDLGGEIQLSDSVPAAEALENLKEIQGLSTNSARSTFRRKTVRSSRCRRQSSSSKACTRTSASAAAKSACSKPARKSRSRCGRNPSSRTKGRTGREGSLTEGLLAALASSSSQGLLSCSNLIS